MLKGAGCNLKIMDPSLFKIMDPPLQINILHICIIYVVLLMSAWELCDQYARHILIFFLTMSPIRAACIL